MADEKEPRSRASYPRDTPPVWAFIAEQHNNSDLEIANAARGIQERWPLGPWYYHSRVMRALIRENSPLLNGARKLTEEYVDLYDLSPEAQLSADLGAVSPLIPVGREQCGFTYSRGRRCERDAIPGAGMCADHGGSWISDSERADMVEKISSRLVDISDRAVAVLMQLMDSARSEKVRFDAAVAILDRIGVGAVTKMELSITPESESAGERMRARLLQLRPDLQVIEGEVESSRVIEDNDVQDVS